MTENNSEAEAPPALHEDEENPDELVGEEVEPDFDPNEEDDE